MELAQIEKLARLIRYYILVATTEAQSGHLTSSLSAVELATILFFRYLRADLADPENPANDRFILSKGHASPLFYALYAACGKLSEEELLSYRQFGSVLEGHPTRRFKYTEAATGSLGQGLSVGVGEAIALRVQATGAEAGTHVSASPPNPGKTSPAAFSVKGEVDRENVRLPAPRVYVLLGDGEMAEGQVWEAIQSAAYYKLNNLVALLDVNRLGQSQQTMYGHDLQSYIQRVGSFGWRTYAVPDGHDLYMLDEVYKKALDESQDSQMPAMIVARTIKGKGFAFMEDRNGWHGKALLQTELEGVLKDLGTFDKNLRGQVIKPAGSSKYKPTRPPQSPQGGVEGLRAGGVIEVSYKSGEQVATRKAYGEALVNLGKIDQNILVLDGDVKNSTFAEVFAKTFPQRYFEMFIAEQNMVSVAVGLARRGFAPFVSTFACFLLRALDQIRMAHLSGVSIVFCGSHAGVAIGQDGPSQMGLEDVALFRSLLNTVVVQPADAVATEKLLRELWKKDGIRYIRTMREATPVIYGAKEEFTVGGSKIFKNKGEGESFDFAQDKRRKGEVTVVAAGITLHEALKAQKELAKEEITTRVIDCYSIKPIDTETLKKAAAETQAIITVEDHYVVGGLGDAVLEALAEVSHPPVYKLAVKKIPRSGKPAELLDYEDISAKAIVTKVRAILG